MSATATDVRVLVVSSNAKATAAFGKYLSEYETTVVGSLSEARERIPKENFEVVILSAPLPSGKGTGPSAEAERVAKARGADPDLCGSAELRFAAEIVGKTEAGVMLVCPPENFEEISRAGERMGVYCLKRPLTPQTFVQGVRLVVATGVRLRGYFAKTETLKEKMEEVKLVGRAKLLLITKLGLTEEEAHRYIEKQAMDKCVRRAVIATELIKTYIN